MKSLRQFVMEVEAEHVYVVYFEDGTMENFYYDEKDAKEAADRLNKEMPSNKCTVKKEPKSKIEK